MDQVAVFVWLRERGEDVRMGGCSFKRGYLTSVVWDLVAFGEYG